MRLLPAILLASLVPACASTTARTALTAPGQAAKPAMAAGSDTSAPRPVVTARGATLTPASLPADACSGIEGNAESVALFDRACDGGDAQGCFEAAKGYMCGTGVPKDLRKAADRA